MLSRALIWPRRAGMQESTPASRRSIVGIAAWQVIQRLRGTAPAASSGMSPMDGSDTRGGCFAPSRAPSMREPESLRSRHLVSGLMDRLLQEPDAGIGLALPALFVAQRMFGTTGRRPSLIEGDGPRGGIVERRQLAASRRVGRL